MKCEDIHKMIIAEDGTLLHFGDKTVIIHIYSYDIHAKHSDEDRMRAARFFWDYKASDKLKQAIATHRSAWSEYCKTLRVGPKFGDPLPPGLGSSNQTNLRARHAKVPPR